MIANHAHDTSRDKGQTVQAAAAGKVRDMSHQLCDFDPNCATMMRCLARQQDIETEAMLLNTPLWKELNDHTRGKQQ